MTYESVPTASTVAIGVTLVLCFTLPIVLLIVFHKKFKARILPFFIGCAIFYLFALTLEQAFHGIIFRTNLGLTISKNIVLYALYGGFAAGLFEEAGRYLGMKIVSSRGDGRENALTYGAGHGGIEAIMVTGMAYVNNVLYTMVVNSGLAQSTLDSLDAATAASTEQIFIALTTTPAYAFALAGVERILAIALQIALSVIVLTAVRRGDRKFVLIAFAIHMAVDTLAVLAASFMSAILVELLVLVMTGFVVAYAVQLYRAEAEPPAAVAPVPEIQE